jgi:hypothetical protein
VRDKRQEERKRKSTKKRGEDIGYLYPFWLVKMDPATEPLYLLALACCIRTGKRRKGRALNRVGSGIGTNC